MKLSIPRRDLISALSVVHLVAKAGAASSTVPILANVLLVANDKSVTFTSCDLDITLRQAIKAGGVNNAFVTTAGKTTVRASLLYDIARSGNADAVSFNLVRNALHVECGSVKFKLSTLNAEEFPPMPALKEAVEFTLDEAALHSMLSRTIFATGNDAERFVLNGSFLQLNGQFHVAACDGRRLGLVTADMPVMPGRAGAKLELILPAKAVRELLRLLDATVEEGKTARKVQIAASKNFVRFTFGDTVINTKLIEGEYPNFRQIIPESDVPVVTINRIDLLRAVERVALVATGVRLEFSKQTLHITSMRAPGEKDLFGEASDSLLCAASKDVTVSLGARYLRDALMATTADEVQFFAENNNTMLKSTAENWLAVIAGMKGEAAK